MSKLFYGLYDLANSAYTMIIITFVTSTYFANQIVGNPQLGADIIMKKSLQEKL